MKVRSRPRIVVIYNRDFEGAEADPENKAREDVKDVACDILRVLRASVYETEELGVTNDVSGAIASLTAMKPAVVFNLCESIHGDNRFESLMPLLMDLSNIAYTGSCPFGLSLALRKEKVKDILRGAGVPVARGGLVTSVEDCSRLEMVYPAIVKPAREDASVGICSASVTHNREALQDRVAYVLENYRQPALVEEFVEGREIYVSILERANGGAPMVFPFFEIDFSDMPSDRPNIVSFEGKWVEDSIEYKGTRPVRCEGLSDELRGLIAKTALDAFRAAGLRDYGRLDFRLSNSGVPYVLGLAHDVEAGLRRLAERRAVEEKAGGARLIRARRGREADAAAPGRTARRARSP